MLSSPFSYCIRDRGQKALGPWLYLIDKRDRRSLVAPLRRKTPGASQTLKQMEIQDVLLDSMDVSVFLTSVLGISYFGV